jgi:hypothetical protein
VRIVLCCGSRHWRDREMCAFYLGRLAWSDALVIHGGNGYDETGRMLDAGDDDMDAVRGADMICGSIAQARGHEVRRFFADWDNLGRSAGPARNRRMLDFLLTHATREDRLVLAFHDNPWTSKGTGNMLGLARRAEGIPIYTIDGKGMVR